MYDLLITNGRIIDGTGNPWYRGDVGIKDGKIVRMGNLRGAETKERIDVHDLVISPGFIDIHCHSDALLFVKPREQGKILQGVTTETIGNCGISVAPIASDNQDSLKKYTSSILPYPMEWNWGSYGEFLARVEEQQFISNVASLVGHGTIRIAVMGFADRVPTEDELAMMKGLLVEALEAGAFGLSSGLIYAPGVYSEKEEMIELSKVVASKGGVYATHMRGEIDAVIDSVLESIEVAEKSGVSLEISHHKTAGKENWGKSKDTLLLVDQARARGVDVTLDQYPYIAASTMLGVTLPPWVHVGGTNEVMERLRNTDCRKRIKEEMMTGVPGWENYVKACGWDKMIVATCNNNRNHEGKSIEEIAGLRGLDPADTVFDLMLEEEGNILMIYFMMSEDDVTRIMRHPAVMIGSDAIPSPGKTHPRYYGAFPRVLGKYVREEKVLSLEEAVRKMTSFPAQKLGVFDRGILKEGMWADITVFDPDNVKDKATFLNPKQYAEGIEYVIVNGEVVVRNGKYTGSLPGKLLRKA